MGFLYSQFFVTPVYPTSSCAGQTIIVTGANTGLGKEAARHFARLGASTVILAVRNSKAGEEAKRSIEETTKCGADVLQVWPLDLISPESCKAFAERASHLPRIDALLENAGIATDKFSLENGYERNTSVNVIGTFYLALLMLPKLKESAQTYSIRPRLTIVSSEVHARAPKFAAQMVKHKDENVFEMLNDESKSLPDERYPISKLLSVLVVRQLAPKLEGSGVVLNVLNPGLCHSELSRDGSFIFEIIKFILARTTEVGSRTLVASVVAGPESHGKYMTDGIVDDGALDAFVTSEDGKEAGWRVWKELSEILGKMQPGILRNVDSGHQP